MNQNARISDPLPAAAECYLMECRAVNLTRRCAVETDAEQRRSLCDELSKCQKHIDDLRDKLGDREPSWDDVRGDKR